MPPFTLELAVNIPTLIAIMVGIWKASALVSKLEAKLETLKTNFDAHVVDDKNRLDEHGKKLEQIGQDLVGLRLSGPHRR